MNSQTKIKALFFDFDGTIVDSSKSIFASIQSVSYTHLTLPTI